MVLLLVDDDDGFRNSMSEYLRDDGHTVIDYGNPAYVPSFKRLGAVALLIVDYHMPNESGLSFADRFHETFPTVPVLMITAYVAPSLRSAAALRSFLSVCEKPLDGDALKWLRSLASTNH